jgi:hypothetical protein
VTPPCIRAASKLLDRCEARLLMCEPHCPGPMQGKLAVCY